jgi:two-component system, NarL family, response regulator LiaR
MPIHVIVVEDHPLMMKAIVDELSAHHDIRVVGTANHGSELPRLVRDFSPDVAILDLGMSSGVFEPITAVRSLLKEHPEVRILVLTGYDDDVYVRELVDAGVYGYVLKSDDLSLMLPNGVRKVYEGSRFYSPDVVDKFFSRLGDEITALNDQELAVLRLAAMGHATSSIADALNVSEKRVRNLFSIIYSKLDIRFGEGKNMRVAAINKARELGLLPSD